MIYTLMKRMIARGGYDRAEFAAKIAVFRQAGRLTEEECAVLTALMAQKSGER